jgi:hypothetical protein
MEVNDQLHVPAALTQGIVPPWCPLDGRLCKPQSRPGLYGEEKISGSYRDSRPDPSAVQPVPLSLYRLSYPDYFQWIWL